MMYFVLKGWIEFLVVDRWVVCFLNCFVDLCIFFCGVCEVIGDGFFVG